jgi:hypothetical protein
MVEAAQDDSGTEKEISGMVSRKVTPVALRPITELERGIVAIICQATFPPATRAKRFVHDLSSGRIQNLSDGGREFLGFIAHRFRRQYSLTPEQWQWVNEWNRWPKTTR